MSVTNLELFVFLYCCRSAHSALHKRNTQPILMQFKITVLPQQSNSKILQTQLHKRTRKASDTKKRKDLKFRDRTAKPKDHVTQETMKYIKIISIWRERHDTWEVEINDVKVGDIIRKGAFGQAAKGTQKTFHLGLEQQMWPLKW